MKLLEQLKRYAAGPDPLTDVANSVALVIVGNQPLYPIYVWLLIGGAGARLSLLTWLSTPFFALTPALGRRSAIGGRALLCLAGIGNTGLSILALGAASGCGLFLLPCFILCIGLFWRDARGLALAAATIALTLLLRHTEPWFGGITAAQSHALFRLNAYSVVTLTIFLGFLFTRAYRRSRPT